MSRRVSYPPAATVPDSSWAGVRKSHGGWPAALTMWAGVMLLAVSFSFGGVDSIKTFEIAAGDAAETLRFFAEQSSEQVVYPPRDVRGVKTNPISGPFTPLAALQQMLSGTALSVLHDKRTGALAIKRDHDPKAYRPAQKRAKSDRPIPTQAAQNHPKNSGEYHVAPRLQKPSRPFFSFKRFFELGVSPASGQPAFKASAKGHNNETLALDPFEIVMTQNKGYHTPYTGRALKTNEDIMEIPQSVTVITRDMIDDIASFELSDMLNYVAVGNFQQGDSAYVRGHAANLNTDGAGDGSPSMMPDSATIDSITIVRGPIGVLYGGNSSITGAVVRQTRVPLNRRQTVLKGQVDEWGFHRFELDDTGPLGEIGEARFTYRFDFAHQGGKTFLRNVKQDRKVYFGVVQLKYRNTTLRVNAQYQDMRAPPHKNNPATPDGLPWLGAGRNESFLDEASMLRTKIRTFRLVWNQRFSSDWALSSYAGTSSYRYGPRSVLLLDQIDFQREIIRLLARRNNAGVQAYNLGGDLTGKYTWFGREMRTNLGFTAWNNQRKPYDHFANPDFGAQNAHIGTPVRSGPTALGFDRVEIPFANARQALDRINHVPHDQYRIPSTAMLGTLVDTTEANVYFQQNVDLLPNRLTATGALSHIVNHATSQNYTAVSSSRVKNRNHRILYRYGLVLNINQSIALYGVETTSVAFINSSSRVASGELIPPRDGIMREGGIKASLLDGRISATASVYTTYHKNWAVSRTGGVIPEFGFNVFDLVKDSYIKGWDFSLAARPVPTWQLMFNCTAQDPRIQATNTRLPSSNRGSWSVFTTYTFTAEALAKFRIGGGANRFYSRLTSAAALILPNGLAGSNAAAGATGGQLTLQDGTMTTAFIEYTVNRRFSLKLNVNNVFDKVMVIGAQNWGAVDPSQPRTFSLIGTYTF